MSVNVSKIDGKIYSLYMISEDLEHFLSLVQTLWNQSDMGSDNPVHKRGIKVMNCIMRDYV